MQSVELKRGLPASNLKAALGAFLSAQYHRPAGDFEEDLDELEGCRMAVINASATSNAIPAMVK